MNFVEDLRRLSSDRQTDIHRQTDRQDRDFLLFCSCDFDLDPMTFIYELDPHSLEI